MENPAPRTPAEAGGGAAAHRVTRGWGLADRDHRAPGQHRGYSGKGLPLLLPVLHVPSCSFKGTNICMLAQSSFSNPTKILTLGRREC